MTTVIIRYKSGREVKVRVEHLKIKYSNDSGEITAVEWRGMVPRPLHFGITEVESIWET